jgi:hypothetical protein
MDRKAREIMKQRLQIMMRAALQPASIHFLAGYHFYKVQHIVAKMAEYINFADSLYCIREGK